MSVLGVDNVLNFDNISLVINDKMLLAPVSGQIDKGETIALVGRSGSGKSLFLQVLADLIRPTTGTLSLHRTPYHSINPTALRQQVMMIHQEPAFVQGTVLDNLCLPYHFKIHKNQAFDKDWHIYHCQRFEKSADFLDKDISLLSGGERQLVNFLRVLQFSPSVLLLDEPTAALDDGTASELIQLTKAWQAQARSSIVWITHTPSEIQKLDARTWVMDNGHLTIDDTNHGASQ